MGRVVDMLASFDVTNARCYDPNEAKRLKKVINALGKARFNECIQRLGVSLGGTKRRTSQQRSSPTQIGSERLSDLRQGSPVLASSSDAPDDNQCRTSFTYLETATLSDATFHPAQSANSFSASSDSE